MDVYDPSGATEVTRVHAPRPDALAGKTIALLSDDMWQAHRILPLVGQHLARRFPGVQVIAESELPMGNTLIDRDETAEILARKGIDAVVVGNAS